MKSIHILIVTIILTLFSMSALAHSGRTDHCGGHHDRKHGGYHVHNLALYCHCYPNADICKKKK